MLSPEETHRYSRQILLPEFGTQGQYKLLNTKVLVIGAGGLGSPALLYLAAAGIGRLGIIDFDVVDISNLQRQVLFTTADVGKPKAQLAVDRVRAINPSVKTDVYVEQLTSANALSILSKYDLILDGSDNLPTRYLVNDACILLKKTLIYGAVFQFEGQASVFNQLLPDGTHGPNYRDLFPQPPPPDMVPSCSEGGVLGVLPGVIGTLQASEAIKVITGIGSTLSGRLLLYDGLDFSIRTVNIRKDESNPISGKNPSITSLIDYGAFCNPIKHQSIPEISVQELKKMMISGIKFQLIDVREPSEVAIVSLQGLNIPLKKLNVEISTISKEIPVIIHCKSGGRSASAVRTLQAQGFTNVQNLEGGILKWIAEIDPTLTRY
jgi:molybdopterin/thiamine biosynthesis adenylyltransferase/rhodanese-related sulfurtransferase